MYRFCYIDYIIGVIGEHRSKINFIINLLFGLILLICVLF